MPDFLAWLQAELEQGLAGVRVSPEADAKIESYPALIWAVSLSNPDPLGLWSANLTLNLLCAPAEAQALASQITALARSWQTPGPLHSAELLGFAPGGRAVSKTIRQYTFTWALAWDI
jgi:hypothetical protein